MVPQNKWVYFIVIIRKIPFCKVKTLITDPITEIGAGPVELGALVARVLQNLDNFTTHVY